MGHVGFDVMSETNTEPLHASSQQSDAQALKQLREECAARDNYLSVVSHELRTPLQSILGWVRLLRAGKLDTGHTERALETIERAARNQARMIEDLLDVSRLISGTVYIEPRPVELNDVLRQTMESEPFKAAGSEIQLSSSLPAEFPVNADPLRLRRALTLLLQYALHHRRCPQPEVTANHESPLQLNAERIDSGGRECIRFHVQIRTTLDPAACDTLFNELIWDSGTPEHPNLGPGLALVRRTAELHGGSASARVPGNAEPHEFLFEVQIPRGELDDAGEADAITQ